MGFNKIVKVLCLGLALTLVGCATQNRQAYKKLRKNIQEKKIDSAIELVKSDKFYPEKRSKLYIRVSVGVHCYAYRSTLASSTLVCIPWYSMYVGYLQYTTY